MDNSIFITLRVIVRSLFPGDTRLYPPEQVPLAPAELESVAGRDGRLSFFIPGCAAPAAPFVLFRLKRAGFSDCRATAEAKGLQIEARR